MRDLFYATPARLKFLKLDRTEADAVREAVRRLAMSRPDVAFTLAGEERAPVTFAATLPGATGRLTRLGDVLGADFRANAVEVVAEREGVKVEGFAALPTLTRANALGQYLFVNDRPVRDKLLLGAVRAAYADYLPRDRHPLVALFVTLESRELDVNVHPAKTEVRFRNAGLVRALIGARTESGAGARRNARGDDRRGRHHRGVPARIRRVYVVADRGARRGGYDWRRSPARRRSRRASAFRRAAALPRLRRRRSMSALRRSAANPPCRNQRGVRGRSCVAGAGGHRASARRRLRAGARHLYRGADARRARYRRSARRA